MLVEGKLQFKRLLIVIITLEINTFFTLPETTFIVINLVGKFSNSTVFTRSLPSHKIYQTVIRSYESR